ncbi:triose-phosphate isomerase [Proteiniclasticum sp. BAD-10]|uniref:Triosephosphate isomerase n=1 Tax=Proteiniclasticum sediminis TaxID=2804028 RepID=A0A941CQX1_9CLOT|nr:triose-phosphate isomerase [Proteiniclasticum sediminis]MBR0576143.1 triose-phosphate isomerase [Proteiniclasticum sediminis]
MRKPIIAGNWKMHYTVDEAVAVAKALTPLVKDAEADVVICAPYIHLPALVKELEGTNIKVGAQNMHFEEKGAYTGEIAPSMLTALGVEYVIIGHSERRQYFNETDETVNLKLKTAYRHGLLPILCVGESLEDREAGTTDAVIENQINKAFLEISPEDALKTVIAYEPIWAIGTGKTATSEQANETIRAIRHMVMNLYGAAIADAVRIQYGGSVKPSTIKEQMGMSDIDGALVGGASLVADDFAKIVNF